MVLEMVVKYTEIDYLNSVMHLNELNEINKNVKINIAELLFMCVDKSRSFVVSILSLELKKYYTSQFMLNALVEKILERR